MAVQNPNDPFRFIANTQAINHIPNDYGMFRQSDIFKPHVNEEGSTTLRFMRNNNSLVLVPEKNRGDDGTAIAGDDRSFLYMEIPHFPLSDQVSPESVRERIDFLTGKRMDTFAEKKARVMIQHRNAHGITEEHLLAGAISGVIKNEAGSVIYNLFDFFGVTKKTIDFELSNTALDVRAVCMSVVRWIEDNLEGDIHTGIEVFCSSGFFDALTGHANVKNTFLSTSEAKDKVGGDVRKGFNYGGILFKEYTGKANGSAGVLSFVGANIAQAVPIGTIDTFRWYPGPPVLNGINLVNSAASAPMYAMETPDRKGRFVDLDSELNMIPVCVKPKVLVELTMS